MVEPSVELKELRLKALCAILDKAIEDALKKDCNIRIYPLLEETYFLKAVGLCNRGETSLKLQYSTSKKSKAGYELEVDMDQIYTIEISDMEIRGYDCDGEPFNIIAPPGIKFERMVPMLLSLLSALKRAS